MSQTTAPTRDLARWGLLGAFALMGLAMAVPAVTGWNVHVFYFPPLHADWNPRVGIGTLPAVVLAGVVAWGAIDRADRLPWRRLLLETFVVGLAWMLALAFVDGPDGVGVILQTSYEYLQTARTTSDFGATLHEYVSRIGFDAPDNWPVHIAGHPPGALLFFVVLVRLGLGAGFVAGLIVTIIAATTALAVLQTLKVLGAEESARRAAPFLAFGTAAIWQSVSADAMFAAVGAWGLCCLAVAVTRRTTVGMIGWSVGAGLFLGYGVMMSYGLPLLGILALAILWIGRDYRPIVPAALAALAVVAAFYVGGFSYLEAIPVLRDRYYEGVAGRRPPSYWMWANVAAFCFSAGPLVGAGLGQLVAGGLPRRDSPVFVVSVLAVAGWLTVLAADLSQMSRAEVERIWLPFVPWALLACALLPERWRRRGLVIQVVAALVFQHLLSTGW